MNKFLVTRSVWTSYRSREYAVDIHSKTKYVLDIF